MLKRYFFLTIVWSLFLNKTFAQVNVQTGSAVFNLPMFNWQDNKSRLHLNISLNYNSGNGLRVNEIASTAGQGWNLAAGGVITRMQVGDPDDQYPYYNNPNNSAEQIDDATKYPAGYLYNTDDVEAKGCPSALANYPIFGDKNHLYKQHNIVAKDREMDYFAFNFNGKNGMFVLNKNDNTGFMLGDSKVKIWFSLSPADLKHITTNKTIRTRISTFFIQDEDGLIYRFGTYEFGNFLPVHGLTKVLKTAYCDINGIQSLTQPEFKSNQVYYQGLFDDAANIVNPYVINSWYLTEIIDPLSITNPKRKIQFIYTFKAVTDPVQLNITYNQEKNYSIISRKATQSEVPELTNISFPNSEYVVDVAYGKARLDLKPTSNTEQALSSITVRYQTDNGTFRYLSRHELKTSYFILNRYGTPSSDFEKSVARLCLLSIKKYGADLKADENPYLFDYNIGSDNADDFVPPYSFPLKDIWGYYNGNNSKAYNNTNIISGKPVSQLTIFDINNNNDCKGLCFLNNTVTGVFLNAKNGYAKNGLLRQIVYPTGGTLSYSYEQNTGIFRGETTSNTVGGVHISQTNSTDGGYSNGCDNPIITQYNFINPDNSSSLWGIERPVNVSPANTNVYATVGHHYTWSFHNFPVGNCSYKFQYPGIMYEEEKMSTKWIQVALAIVSDVLEVVSDLMVIRDVVTVVTGGSPLSLILDVIFGLVNLWISCHNNINKTTTSTVNYDFDLNGINSLPAQFKRVEIIANTGDIGKTVQTFTSPSDYALWQQGNPDFLMWQRYGHWLYGLPKLVTTYDKDDNKVKETEYNYYAPVQYEFTCSGGQSKEQASTCVRLTSCNCEVLTNRSQRSDDWSDVSNISYSPTSDIDKHLYYYYSGRLNVSDVYERTFKPNSTQYLQTSTHYDYDNNSSYEQNALDVFKTTITQSNGDVATKYIKYSGDFPVGILYRLDTNNCVSVPVETINSITKYGGTEQYLNDKVTEFAAISTGIIVPSRSLEQRFNAPQNSMTWYQGPTGSNPPYIQTQIFNYDATGNLNGIKDEGSHAVTNTYDYADRFIVASVINADPNADKPAYTSFETTGMGCWLLTGTAAYDISKAITGSRSLILSTGVSLKVLSLNTSRAYKLSFWATSSGVSVSAGATLTNNSFTANGFTFYEYNIAQGTSSVTVSGTSTIDELRLYPATARMRTTAYDPIIGKTAECDENNRITYYEYDELGRMRFIKDENKNVVKMYEYNTVSNKQSGCPATYYNHLITETFTKSNCAAGYQGLPVTYIVQPNTYSSIISQADADQQAENEINKYGQANADNTITGACALIYYNAGLTKTFYTQGCPVNQYGAAVSYAVPANRYSSIISQAVVDQMEQDDMNANGQANANNAPNRSCINTTDPFWEATDPATTKCDVDNTNANTGHLLVWMTQINPNCTNPAYGTKAWQDAGLSPDDCPPPSQYSPTLLNGPCNGISGSYKMYGNAGDIVTLKLDYSGVEQWNGLNNGVGASMSLTCSNQACSSSSPHDYTGNTTSFSLTCSITLTMPANYVLISTSAVLNNSSYSSAASATLSVVSVNGNTNGAQTAACSGNSGGGW